MKESKVNWNEVAVDTKVLVRDNEYMTWIKGYFAKYEDGLVYTFAGGRTSWNEEHMYNWPEYKLADEK